MTLVDIMMKTPGQEDNELIEPRKIDENVLTTWNKLGPLKISHIVKNSVTDVNYSLKFGVKTDKN